MFKFRKKTVMADLIGHFAETNGRVGDLPHGHQVILIEPIDNSKNPLFLVESRGRRGFVHLSDVIVFENTIQV
jgi:hypothetical protein